MEAAPRSLPRNRAFVLQLRETAAGTAEVELTGRVEHLVSGAAAHFESADELLAFIKRVLGERREIP